MPTGDFDCASQIRRLEAEVEFWKSKAQSNWDIVETVALGEKLECEVCGKYHPCCCDK